MKIIYIIDNDNMNNIRRIEDAIKSDEIVIPKGVIDVWVISDLGEVTQLK